MQSSTPSAAILITLLQLQRQYASHPITGEPSFCSIPSMPTARIIPFLSRSRYLSKFKFLILRVGVHWWWENIPGFLFLYIQDALGFLGWIHALHCTGCLLSTVFLESDVATDLLVDLIWAFLLSLLPTSCKPYYLFHLLVDHGWAFLGHWIFLMDGIDHVMLYRYLMFS